MNCFHESLNAAPNCLGFLAVAMLLTYDFLTLGIYYS